ncbi:hypothetical protein AAG906_020049 [Vitis piasezkii]
MSRTPNPLTNPPSNPQILSLFNPGKTLRHLKQLHAQIITHHYSPFQLSALASLSALSPFPTFLAYAKTICHHLQNPPPSLYNSLIRALSSGKTPLEALPLYHTMLQSGLKPDHMTYPFVIKACNESSVTWFGLLVHTDVVKSGFECDSYIVSSLIHLYANGKDLGAAKQLFNLCSDRDVVSWNAMIDGYVKRGEMGHARMVFDRMVCRDVISWNTMINGYAIVGKIDEAKRLFDEMPDRNLVSWNSMVWVCQMWECGGGFWAAKCGKISLATQVFNAMESKDVLAWNTIIAGMAIHGHVKEAQQFFKEMKEAGVEPNDITFVAMLDAAIFGMIMGLSQRLSIMVVLLISLPVQGLLEEAMEIRGPCPWSPTQALGEMVGKRLINLHHATCEEPYEGQRHLKVRVSVIGEGMVHRFVVLFIVRSAIAYGLLHLDSKEAIRIVKNLRVCRDCHHVTKLISKVYGQAIIVRDRNRFHHFEDDECSCLDFWKSQC